MLKNRIVLLSTLAVIVLLIALAFVPLHAQQGVKVVNTLGLNQLPNCPAAPIGTTFVYYTTVVSTNLNARNFTGCATLGPGLSLVNGPTGLPQITAPTSTGPTTSLLFTYGELPAGNIDGNNATFTLVAAPNPPASIELFRNLGKAVLCTAQTQTCDFNLSGNTISFLVPPQAGDLLVAGYRTQ